MKNILANIWTKRVFSIFSGFYAFGACFLCYCSLFYTVEITSKSALCVLLSGISLFFLVIMIYTRKQLITTLSSFVILPAMLPVILFYFGEWHLIIPIVAVGIIIFLMSGAGEALKTTLGTIFLLLYIFGSLGYFLVTSLFVTVSKSEVVNSGVSPSGMYRYEVITTQDSSNGSTAIYIEPNNADISFPKLYITFKINNFERIVYLERPLTNNINVEWTQMTRQEITQQLTSVSDHIILHLTEKQLEDLGYTYEEKLVLIDLEYQDYEFLGLPQNTSDEIYLNTLTTEQLAYFNIAKDSNGYYVLSPDAEFVDEAKAEVGETLYLKDLNSDLLSDLYIEKDDSVILNQLTDEELAILGVPETGDVMTFNGQICFRYYVAILENYFDVSNKSIKLF